MEKKSVLIVLLKAFFFVVVLEMILKNIEMVVVSEGVVIMEWNE